MLVGSNPTDSNFNYYSLYQILKGVIITWELIIIYFNIFYIIYYIILYYIILYYIIIILYYIIL